MAKSNYNSLNLWRGRIAGQVYKAVRGKQVIATYVPASNPNTSRQQMVRAQLGIVSRLSGVFRYAIRLGFADDARSCSSQPVSRFIKHNFKNVTGSSPESLSVDPTKLVLAVGTRNGAEFSTRLDTESEAGTIIIQIVNATTPYADEANDLVYGVAYCPDKGQAVLSEGVARTAEKLTIPCPAGWAGMEVYVYGFVVNPKDKQASPSSYIGHANLD